MSKQVTSEEKSWEYGAVVNIDGGVDDDAAEETDYSAATDDLREGGWIGTRNTRSKSPTPSRDAPQAVDDP
jgi:hypothetical protein